MTDKVLRGWRRFALAVLALVFAFVLARQRALTSDFVALAGVVLGAVGIGNAAAKWAARRKETETKTCDSNES